jgi:hypothetical protein
MTTYSIRLRANLFARGRSWQEGKKWARITECFVSFSKMYTVTEAMKFVHVYTVHHFHFHFIVPTGALNIKKNLTL